jgi:hypothetical protein
LVGEAEPESYGAGGGGNIQFLHHRYPLCAEPAIAESG